MAYVPSIRRRRLGAALRRLREQTGSNAADVAERVGWSRSKVTRIETAATTVTPDDVRALLRVYDVLTDEVEGLVTLAREDRQPGWWRQYSEVLPDEFESYLGLESEASRILVYESDAVHGLLQTDEYAAAVLGQHPLAVPYEVRRSVELRRARQSRLDGEDPVQLDAVINEGALLRADRGQLARLVEVSELPNVTIRVLPIRTGIHAAMNGPFTILEFPDPVDPVIVYLDNLVTSYYLEGLREVGTYQLVYEKLRESALDPEASIELIGKLAEESSHEHPSRGEPG